MDTRDRNGNRVGQTDGAYGNPLHGTTGNNPLQQQPSHQTPLQQTHHTAIDGGAQHHQAQMMRPTTEPQATGTTLRRSGSSSSSSSEDDGMGGRRKKGLKEKMKEKLPGAGHKTDEQRQAHQQMSGYSVAPPEQHEKKGLMEKIKEKLPGHH